MSEMRQPEIELVVSRAQQLGAQVHQLARRGDWIGAAGLARQAVEQWRILSERDPVRFLSPLAGSLLVLANYLSRTAPFEEEVFEVARESVTRWRQLAAADQGRFGIELVHALQRLAHISMIRKEYEFVFLREEATTLLIQLAVTNSALLPEVAEDISRTSNLFFQYGEFKKALQYGRQAVELWRTLAAKDLVQFGVGLIEALRHMAAQTTSNGILDPGLLWEARRIAVSRIYFLVQRSLQPKTIVAFAAAATGKALRASRSLRRRRG